MGSDESPSQIDPVDEIAEEYLRRRRRGERPTHAEYAARYPEHADRILELFPALELIERLKPTPEENAGPAEASGTGGGAMRRLGDYTLIREIGRGGMGIVYEAEHESLKSRMALKVMHPRFRADRAYVRRFQTEARSAAKLHHTNIVPVFDYGEEDGICYYAMQYIAGVGLERVLDDVRRLRDVADRDPGVETDLAGQGTATDGDADLLPAVSRGLLTGRFADAATASPLGGSDTTANATIDGATSGMPAGAAGSALAYSVAGVGSARSSFAGQPESVYFHEVARIGAQVADALDHAHSQGVIHRDIKPPNLLLDTRGNVWVTDFGLAKVVEGDDLSQSHDLVGTMRFMAPERFRGVTDARGDVYSLGATLYELLSLRPAFDERDQARLIDQIVYQPPAPLRQHDRRIPRDLETVVLKALGKDPKDRFASAAELADELRRYLESRPIRSRPVGPIERLLRWSRRNPGLAAACIAAVILSLILATGSTMAAWKFRRDGLRIQGADREMRRALFDSLVAQAQARRFSRRVGQRFESLNALEQAVAIARELELEPGRFEQLRDEAIACLALPDMKQTGRVIFRPPDVLLTAFDSTMTRYALRFRDGTILVRRVADDAEIARFQARGDRGIFTFGFSPDGRYLATSHFPEFALTVWDIDQGTVAVSDPGPANRGAAKFSPDSRRLALIHDDGEFLVYDLAGRRQIGRRHMPKSRCPAFDSDGTRIAVLYDEPSGSACQVVEVDSGRLIRSIALPSTGVMCAWSPDGTTLATVCEGLKTYLWDAATGTRKTTVEGNTNSGVQVAFHPVGTLLASKGWEGQLRLWDAALGRPVLSLSDSEAGMLGFSQDGRIVVFGEDRLTTYQVEPALEYRTFATEVMPNVLWGASIRRDGRLLAVARDRGVELWDLATGTNLPLLRIGQTYCVAFEESGDLLTLNSGSLGTHRWPVHLDPSRKEFRIGPPHRLPFTRGVGLAKDRSGRIVAVACGDHALVSTPERIIRVASLDDCRYVAVSPDGQWLATGSHDKNGAEVWHIPDGKRAAHLKVEGLVSVAFSPDGRWLMTSPPPCRLWSVATWQEARRVGGKGLDFSQDGRQLLVQDENKVLRLVDIERDRTVAHFESLDLYDVRSAMFSPDGSRLVVVTDEGPAVHVWDLQAIRRHLAESGLDWDAPPYPAAEPAPPGPLPALVLLPTGTDPAVILRQQASRQEMLQVAERMRILFAPRPHDAEDHHRRGHWFYDRNHWKAARSAFDRAILLRPDDPHFYDDRASCALMEGDDALCASDYRKILELKPDDPDSLRLLAWLYVTGNAEVRRSPDAALPLALKALRLDPKQPIMRITVGAVYYRLGRYDEADRVFEAESKEDNPYRCVNDLFLAMARHRLGRRGEARAAYERALKLPRLSPVERPDFERKFQRLRAEAEAVLAGSAENLPADVFADPQ